ncbi:hypothetical protein DCAR_0519286 [Daucus carota subsp. sativus]|uniref:Uncharacterized protein n=1 Tax=Daucus carota subsp. sativus TaxID=79200 RepID=A0A164XV23_DAUCS|nr:hypothetical protein DCAR_0519286 [Daucus carota subsp. sativus]
MGVARGRGGAKGMGDGGDRGRGWASGRGDGGDRGRGGARGRGNGNRNGRADGGDGDNDGGDDFDYFLDDDVAMLIESLQRKTCKVIITKG